MSDTTDDMEALSGLIPDEFDDYDDYVVKRQAVLEYCEKYIEYMWAARIVGILLGCDFKDAKEHLKSFWERDEYE